MKSIYKQSDYICKLAREDLAADAWFNLERMRRKPNTPSHLCLFLVRFLQVILQLAYQVYTLIQAMLALVLPRALLFGTSIVEIGPHLIMKILAHQNVVRHEPPKLSPIGLCALKPQMIPSLLSRHPLALIL